MPPGLFDHAVAVATRHYELLRAELGVEVRGVWLIGSAILGDLTERSDIDTLTLTSRPVEQGDHEALKRVHQQLTDAAPTDRYETTYVPVGTLAGPAPSGLVTPFSQDGKLRLSEASREVHAVTWFTLPSAFAVAGLAPDEVTIAADRAAAEEHSRGNLQTYWASVAEGLRLQLAGRDRTAPLAGSDTLVWLVLGAPRLAAFLAGMRTRGPIPSKSEAGRWVIDNVPQHADLARRALQARAGHPVRFTVADADEATDLVMAMVHGHG